MWIRKNASIPRLRRYPLYTLLLISLLVGACATAPTFPARVDPAAQGLVDELGQRVLAVSENRDTAALYRFVLADMTKEGFAGLSAGDHLIYVNYEIASRAASAGRDSGYTTFLLMVLAHEIGHDVMGHAPNQRALANSFTAAQGVASGVSYVPGPIGWIGAAASWGFYGAGAAATHLYSRSQELEADRKAIEYWKQMGLDCQAWVRRFQALADKGFKGDFHHPTEGRLEQAKALCPPGSTRPATALPSTSPETHPSSGSSTASSSAGPSQATSQPLPYIGRSDVIYQLGGQYINTGQPCPAGQVEVASGLPNTKACVPPAAYTAHQQQKSGPVTPSLPAQETVGEAPKSGTVPVWESGNEWKFRWTSSGGSGTFVGSIVGEEVVNGVACYVMRVGNQDTLFSKAELALLMARSGGAVNMHASPAYQQFSWPLEAGKEWEVKYRWENPAARQTEDRVRRHKIEAEETISVPAGTFQALHVTVKDLTGKVVAEYWYSPAVKWLVKDRLYRPSGVIERELVEYTLKPTTASPPR